MKIFDRIILTIYTFCLAIVSILLILFPFEQLEFLSIAAIEPYLVNIKGNYWFSFIGLAFLLVSIRFLLSGLSFRKRNKYIVRYTSIGELKISDQTIEGLAQSVTNNFEGIKEIKTGVDLRDEKIVIMIKGVVDPNINIPEIITKIQNRVKEHIEMCTGVEVSEVKVEVSNITTPVKSVR